jgi:recombination protein RecA
MPASKVIIPVPTDMRPRSASGAAFKKFKEDFLSSYADAGAMMGDKLVGPEVFSSGSIALDYALRTGGYPRGRLITFQGSEQTSKTTTAMLGVASAQRTYPEQEVAWVDAEATFHAGWAAALGVDLSRLLIVPKPLSAEETADAVHKLTVDGYFSLVVLDSTGAMTPAAELEDEAAKQEMANLARLLTRLSKQVVGFGARNGTTSIWIHQNRAQIGTMSAGQTPTGGNAPKHLRSIALKFSRGFKKEDVLNLRVNGEMEEIAFRATALVLKNKIAPAGASADLWIYNRETDKYGPPGVGLGDEAVSLGVKTGVVEKKGAWYVLPDGTQHQGERNTALAVQANPAMLADIRHRIIATLGHEPGKLPPGAIETDDTLEEATEEDFAS